MREQEAADKNDRHALEKTDVMKVVTHVSSSVTVNSIRRIGRYDSSRTTGRPVKVTLTSPEEVHELLRKTPNLKKSDAFRKISIFADKTPRQMEYYKTIKKELEDRISNGETNIRIKKLYTPEQLLILYKTQIRPSLEYCSHVWGCAPKRPFKLRQQD
nr:unnamed protein product [Callosobruchus analis]